MVSLIGKRSSSQQDDIIALRKSNAFLFSQGHENEALSVRARREASLATERAAQLEKDAAVARASVADINEAAAKANESAAKANERAATLEKEAAEAREGIARANADAASAKAEQERLKQLVVWRSISDTSAEILKAKIVGVEKTILLSTVANDPEAFVLGAQIGKVLIAAGWKVIIQAATWGNWLPIGVHIYGPDSQTADLLRNAFAAAQIPFDPRSPARKPDMSIDFDQGEPTDATILIGSRIGPF
jgi:hypothetical protein